MIIATMIFATPVARTGVPFPNTAGLVSNPRMLVNFGEALCAVVLGNVAYFLLAPWLPLPPHGIFQFDVGVFVDFWFCLAAYGLIRTARRWK